MKRLPHRFLILSVFLWLMAWSWVGGQNLSGDYYVTGNFRVGKGSSDDLTTTGTIALGVNSTAQFLDDIALGPNSTASGGWSTALGWGSDASGEASTTIGTSAASGSVDAVAIGYQTIANQSYSIAIGRGSSTANDAGQFSMAIGTYCAAAGNYTTAIGYYASSSGNYSIAMGYYANAGADNSIAIGSNVTTASYASLVVGQYNTSHAGQANLTWVGSDDLFVLGNGQNSTVPSDAFVIEKDGDVGINAGNVTMSNTLTVNGTVQINSASGNSSVLLDNSGNFSSNRRQGDVSMGVFGNITGD